MAEALAVAITYASGSTFAFTATQAFFINVAVAVAGSAYQQKEARRRARIARRDGARDREFTVRGAAPPIQYVYGETRVAGHLIDAFTVGQYREHAHLAFALANHASEGVTGYWFAGRRLTIDANGWVTNPEYVRSTSADRVQNLATSAAGTVTLTGATNSEPTVTFGADLLPFTHTVGTNIISGLPASTSVTVVYTTNVITPLIRVRAHLGGTAASFAVDTGLIAESAGRWDASMRGVDVTAVHVSMEFDNLLAAYDVEDWQFLVRGRRVWDPRVNAFAWTSNAGLIAADWMLDDRLGPGVGFVDYGEVAAEANVCDEPVRVQSVYAPTYIAQFIGTLDGWVVGGAGTLTLVGDGTARHVTTAAPSWIERPFANIPGSTHRRLRARIKREAGTGWRGMAYYATPAHPYQDAYRAMVAEPAYGANGWAVVEWDMHALAFGAGDWQTSLISAIRLDLGATPADRFAVDWIALDGTITQRRYTFDGVVTSAQTMGDIMDAMSDAMGGHPPVYTQGRWMLRAGAYRLPTVTIDESALSATDGGVRIVPEPSGRGRYNAVRVRYRGEDTEWLEVAAPLVVNPQYVTEDGGQQVVYDMRVAHDCDSERAQRMGKIALERHRQSVTCTVTANLRAYDVVPTDTVRVRLSLAGFADKAFVVDSRSWVGTQQLQYVLTETDPSVWEWNDGLATVGDPAPNTVLRRPTERPARIAAPLVLAASVADALRLSNDSYLPRVRVAWTAVTDTYVTQGGSIEIEWREAASMTWRALPPEPGAASTTYISPAPQGVIAVRVRARNALGVVGEWTAAALDVPTAARIGSGAIAVGAVGPDQIAPDAVGAAQIADEAVGTAHIAPAAASAQYVGVLATQLTRSFVTGAGFYVVTTFTPESAGRLVVTLTGSAARSNNNKQGCSVTVVQNGASPVDLEASLVQPAVSVAMDLAPIAAIAMCTVVAGQPVQVGVAIKPSGLAGSFVRIEDVSVTADLNKR